MSDSREVFLASDHRGFEKKSEIIENWDDIISSISGAPALRPLGSSTLDEDDDFTTAAQLVAEKVLSNPISRGILLCSTGSGVAMAANRFRGLRAINAWTPTIARLGVEHNHANVLCLPADYLDFPEIREIIRAFLTTSPLGDEKYLRRNAQLDKLEVTHD